MENEELIRRLIHVRTALKNNQVGEALRSVRSLLDTIDPGQKIEMEMRGEGSPKR